MIRVLGVDPGSAKMGYGCIDVDGARMVYVEAGVLTATRQRDHYGRRLVELGRDLEEVIDELRPDHVAVEAGFVQGQMSAIVLGSARGVAMYVAVRRGIPVTEYAPATVKLSPPSGGGCLDADSGAVEAASHEHPTF